MIQLEIDESVGGAKGSVSLLVTLPCVVGVICVVFGVVPSPALLLNSYLVLCMTGFYFF